MDCACVCDNVVLLRNVEVPDEMDPRHHDGVSCDKSLNSPCMVHQLRAYGVDDFETIYLRDASLYSQKYIELKSELTSNVKFSGDEERMLWYAIVMDICYRMVNNPVLIISDRVSPNRRFDHLPPPPFAADIIFFDTSELAVTPNYPTIISTGEMTKIDPNEVMVESHGCFWLRNPFEFYKFACRYGGDLGEVITAYQRNHTSYVYWGFTKNKVV